MFRFFSDNFESGQSLVLLQDPDEVHHLTHVLRLCEGDEIELVNGRGLLVKGVIEKIVRSGAEVKVTDQVSFSPRIEGRIILACAVPKKARFETIIEKCTEAGVDEIIPMKTARTEFSASNRLSKGDRWTRVLLNAVKQSRRIFTPVLHPLTDFSDVIALKRPGTRILIPWLEGERQFLKELVAQSRRPDNFLVIIGPEGDFTPAEVRQAVCSGAIPVTLGENVLRVDTAAVAVVSYIRLSHA